MRNSSIAILLGSAILLFAWGRQANSQNTKYTQPASQCIQVQNVPYGNGVPGGLRHVYNTCDVAITVVVSNPGGKFAPAKVAPGQWTGGGVLANAYKVWSCVSPGTPWDPDANDWPGYGSQRFSCPIQ